MGYAKTGGNITVVATTVDVRSLISGPFLAIISPFDDPIGSQAPQPSKVVKRHELTHVFTSKGARITQGRSEPPTTSTKALLPLRKQHT